MFSEKLEDIPNQHYQRLITFLSRRDASDQKYFDSDEVLSSIEIDLSDLKVLLSELCEENYLSAKINVRCPECDADYGRFDSRSAVPNTEELCVSCGEKIEYQEAYWRVVYSIQDVPEKKDIDTRLKRYVEGTEDLSGAEIEEEFESLSELGPQKRGRMFDYFMGLMFQQVDGVDVRVKQPTKEGEVDLHLILSGADRKLRDTIGTHTMVENKWESDPTQISEIGNFHDKISSIEQKCYLGYFASMSGFTSRAKRKLDNSENPTVISWDEEDINEIIYEEEMVNKLLKDNLR